MCDTVLVLYYLPTLHLIGSRQMEASVRIERVKTTPTYDTAFDHLTNFYKRRKISHDRDVNAVVDLTGEDDESTGVRDERMEQDNDDEEDGDGGMIQRASGLPCMRHSTTWVLADCPANEAILALVDFPKQIVQALSTAVTHMKGRYKCLMELISDFGLENAFRNRSTFTKVGHLSLS